MEMCTLDFPEASPLFLGCESPWCPGYQCYCQPSSLLVLESTLVYVTCVVDIGAAVIGQSYFSGLGGWPEGGHPTQGEPISKAVTRRSISQSYSRGWKTCFLPSGANQYVAGVGMRQGT